MEDILRAMFEIDENLQELDIVVRLCTFSNYTPVSRGEDSLPPVVLDIVNKALRRDNLQFEFRSRGGN